MTEPSKQARHAWAAMINCQRDEYFVNKTVGEKQLAILARFEATIRAECEAKQADAVREKSWVPVTLTAPEKWYRSRAWRWRGSKWIVATAYCPTVLGIGGELLTGYGKGLALFLGPLWLGIAANFEKEPTHDRT